MWRGSTPLRPLSVFCFLCSKHFKCRNKQLAQTQSANRPRSKIDRRNCCVVDCTLMSINSEVISCRMYEPDWVDGKLGSAKRSRTHKSVMFFNRVFGRLLPSESRDYKGNKLSLVHGKQRKRASNWTLTTKRIQCSMRCHYKFSTVWYFLVHNVVVEAGQ